MLYRGVNKRKDEENGGRLLPKGSVVRVAPLRDGRLRRDGKFLRGPCESNTARAHQIETGLYGGAGVSSSRSEAVAIRFATYDYTEAGYVYVIDETRLAAANVNAWEFDDPLEPGEHEVTLVEQAGGALPSSIIVEKYEVSSDGIRLQSREPN